MTKRLLRASDLREVASHSRFQVPEGSFVTEHLGLEARVRSIELIGIDAAETITWRRARGWDEDAEVAVYESRSDELASVLDHTLLRPEATRSDIATVCDEAREHRFASVCVHGRWVAEVTARLRGTGVLTCSVIGFPCGAAHSAAKVAEAAQALADGALELDMVLPVGALVGGEFGAVEHDILSVASVCHANGARLKVILETCLLDDAQKKIACELAGVAGADFVKTSTGFGAGGATPEDVALMRAVVGDSLGVKAAGGIRARSTALAMLEAGASRLGTSASVAIVQG